MRFPLPLAAALAAALTAASPAAAADAPPPPGSAAAVLAAAPASAWVLVPPEDLMIVTMGDGRSVTIALDPVLAPAHVANIRALVRGGWFDGLSINRVQDNYVVQWGDASETKPLPVTLPTPPAEYEVPLAGLALDPLDARDAYAPRVGHVAGWPVGYDPAAGRAWSTHCYASVGVGRNDPPDVGSGAELYAVIGQAPRPLDRNITLVGRVIDGFEAWTALPRGTGPLGFYADPGQRVPIARVRLAADLPVAERPAWQMLSTRSPAYRAWTEAKRRFKASFFVRAPDALDICNLPTPVRRAPAG